MRFEINCPYCNETQYAEPSILHRMGMLEGGGGSCLKCKQAFRLILIIDDEGTPIKMKTRKPVKLEGIKND